MLLSALLGLSFIASGAENEKLYKGIFTWGPEVHSFKSCTDNIDYWLNVNPEVLKLKRFYQANQEKPYQGLYVEFRGHLLNEKLDGFALDYSGLINISVVKNYSFEIPRECIVGGLSR